MSHVMVFVVASLCLVIFPAVVLAQTPLTPILGVSPPELDFGTVPVDSTMTLQLTLSNDVEDPQSVLVVNSLSISGSGFTISNTPPLPLSIPGDSTTVPLTIEFRPPWPVIPASAVRVTAANAINPQSSSRLEGEGSLTLNVEPERIIGYDSDGNPLVCGTGLGDSQEPSRGWECIPSVIRDNGTDSFVLEVDVSGPVTGVAVSNVSTAVFVPPQPLTLRDDGLGGDRVANDFIFTSGSFRYNTSWSTGFYLNNVHSPYGLNFYDVARILVTELDLSVTEFLLRAQVGVLRSEITPTTVTTVTPTIAASSHMINVQTSGRETQHGLRGIESHQELLTIPIYDEFQDAADFFLFLSTDKIEVLPRTTFWNYVAGNYLVVQAYYTGTGLTPFDNSDDYGSRGRLQGFGRIDLGTRGVYTQNVTHELLHQWGAYISPALGLQTGTHYYAESSVGSLLGGFRWIDNGNGTFTLDCTEGRGAGAHDASLLDKYLMGLIPGASVVPMHVDHDLVFPDDCGGLITQSEIDRTTTIDDIQAVHGIRFPGYLTAQRNFSVAFVIESHDRLLNAAEMTFYEILTEYYTRLLGPGEPDPYVATTNWVPITRFFGEGTSWRSDFPVMPPIGVVDMTPGSGGEPRLEPASPNPLNGTTDIRYTLPSKEMVHLEIYDIGGRLVRRLVHAPEEAGTHVRRWDGCDGQGRQVASGVYYYRLSAGEWQAARAINVVK